VCMCVCAACVSIFVTHKGAALSLNAAAHRIRAVHRRGEDGAGPGRAIQRDAVPPVGAARACGRACCDVARVAILRALTAGHPLLAIRRGGASGSGQIHAAVWGRAREGGARPRPARALVRRVARGSVGVEARKAACLVLCRSLARRRRCPCLPRKRESGGLGGASCQYQTGEARWAANLTGDAKSGHTSCEQTKVV
jgi:hypothetical protein